MEITMPFTEVVKISHQKGVARSALITSVRMCIMRRKPSSPQLFVYLQVPPDMLKELDWQAGDHFDVIKGDGEDAGWFAIRLNPDMKEGGKLQVRRSGVGSIQTSRLVPDGMTEPVRTTSPASRISDGMLLIKVA